jgi:hypothetical protein
VPEPWTREALAQGNDSSAFAAEGE